jgi:hypothetical protein
MRLMWLLFLDRERIDCLSVSYLARGRTDPNVLHNLRLIQNNKRINNNNNNIRTESCFCTGYQNTVASFTALFTAVILLTALVDIA